MHAGYADVASADRHIVHAVKALRASPQWKNMVIVITVDENGGWWDHVAPPKGDRWGLHGFPRSSFRRSRRRAMSITRFTTPARFCGS